MDDLGVIDVNRLEPEYADIVKKVHDMSVVEQLAILDFVNFFWSGDWNSVPDLNEILDKYEQEL